MGDRGLGVEDLFLLVSVPVLMALWRLWRGIGADDTLTSMGLGTALPVLLLLVLLLVLQLVLLLVLLLLCMFWLALVFARACACACACTFPPPPPPLPLALPRLLPWPDMLPLDRAWACAIAALALTS